MGHVLSALIDALGVVLIVLAVAGLVYQAVLLKALGDWFDRPAPEAAGDEGVTLLKPLHGAEPQLAANLASFLATAYTGAVQMVCGVNEPGDSALAAVADLRAAHPQAQIAVSPGPRTAGKNAKIGNLTAMMPLAAHDLLVLSDSDMAVRPDYLPKVLGALSRPDIGVVSCLYVGRADAGIWSRLGAAAISYANMPGMALALRYGLSHPCMGSTIAIRRETLDRIGGFATFRDELADDYAIGAAVRGLGLRIAVPPMVLVHACDEATFGALWRHHLRWMVTLRGIVGPTHVGTLLVHALPLALLAALFAPKAGAVLIALALLMRYAVKRRVDRLAPSPSASFAALYLADCVEFAIFCASLVTQKIDWRGERLVMAADGRIQARS
jgi:ceramide glucosyltransferase